MLGTGHCLSIYVEFDFASFLSPAGSGFFVKAGSFCATLPDFFYKTSLLKRILRVNEECVSEILISLAELAQLI
jgi:hypothetical protein